VKTSNVIDVEVEVKIVRHRQMATACPECGHINVGEMPGEASHSMVYGSGLRSFVVLLSSYACVGMKKISGLLGDVFGVPISPGTIANMNAGFAERSAPLLCEIKERAIKSPVLNADETGMNVNGTNWWLHTASTSELTYMTAHGKRGKEGIDQGGVLPEYTGVVVHDFWSPYFKYSGIGHAMCCAHLLRELKWVTENTPQTWAAAMSALLVKMKLVRESYMEAQRSELSQYYAAKFAREYADIIALGEREAPCDHSMRKQSKSRNLLERFIEYKNEITFFANDFNVPFTNNQAERDIRNAKVKQKVSGAFRSNAGIHSFAAISSVIGTAAKQGLSVFVSLKNILAGNLSSLFYRKISATE
jgi:transposase